MRRTLTTLGVNAREWDERAASIPDHTPTLGQTTIAGAVAYAHKQADIQRKMAEVFLGTWYEILKDQPLAASWLCNHPPPQTNKRRRLANNITLYHSTSIPPVGTLQVSDASSGIVNPASPSIIS